MSIRLICLAVASLAAVVEAPCLAAPPAGLPALTSYQAPTFPDELRLTSIADGYVVMIFTVSSDGTVEDALALEASHPAFVAEMNSTLPKWRFEPASSATVPRRETIQFDFRRSGMAASLNHFDAASAAFQNLVQASPSVRTLEWEQLDRKPARIAAVMPARATQASSGAAEVSFVIDRSGSVRVPAIVAATEPAFGEAVLKAVRQWQFEAPMQQGKAVNVRATRSFRFGKSLPKAPQS